MQDVRPIHIDGELPQDIVVGSVMPNIEYDEKLRAYHVRAYLVEQGTNKIVAGWEYTRLVASKRNASRMAKKVAQRMAARLNESAKEEHKNGNVLHLPEELHTPEQLEPSE